MSGPLYLPAVAEDVGRRAVEIMDDEAAHRFESDGFDEVVARDAIDAIRNDGYTKADWYTSPDVADDIREWYTDRVRVAANEYADFAEIAFVFPIIQARDGVIDDAMYLIGRGAVVPNTGVYATRVPIIVRNPSGIAVVDV